MTKNSNVKLIIYSAIVGVVILIIGLALATTSKTQKEQNQATDSTNSLVGKTLPDMQLTDKTGQLYSLENLKGKNVVLFFSEGIMCYPACWDQIVAFGTDPRFNSSDTIALSVVTDQPSEWEQAKSKMPDITKATILFDQGARASKQYGLLSAHSSMHAGEMPGHSYILIDKQGIVRDVYDDNKMAVNNDLISQKINEFNK